MCERDIRRGGGGAAGASEVRSAGRVPVGDQDVVVGVEGVREGTEAEVVFAAGYVGERWLRGFMISGYTR